MSPARIVRVAHDRSGSVAMMVGGVMKWLRRLSARLKRAFACDGYRPEAHYMRGPGPKTLEKAVRGAAKR